MTGPFCMDFQCHAMAFIEVSHLQAGGVGHFALLIENLMVNLGSWFSLCRNVGACVVL